MVDSLKNHIQEDMKAAMRARQRERLITIRLLLAAIKQREVDERIVLSDLDIVNIINKMIKQRLDSIAQFQVANRTDLVNKEQAEIELLKAYLPTPFTDAEIDLAIQTAMEQSQAKSVSEMGKIMAVLKVQFAGRADMAQVSAKVKSLLQ